jgi:hypothetical protein
VTLVTFARACRNAVLLECGFPHTKSTSGAPKCSFTSPPQPLPPWPPTSVWRCPGGRFFMKNRVAAHVRVTAAHTRARSRTKSPRAPQGRQSGAQKLTFTRTGPPFCENLRQWTLARTFVFIVFSSHLHARGRFFSHLELAWGRAWVPDCLFSSFCRPRCAKVTPKGAKGCPM